MAQTVLTEQREYEDFANLIVFMLKESGIRGLVEMLAGGARCNMFILRPKMIHHIEAVFEREFGFSYKIQVGRMLTGEGLMEDLYRVLTGAPNRLAEMEARWQALKEKAGEYDLPPAKGGTRSGGGL